MFLIILTHVVVSMKSSLLLSKHFGHSFERVDDTRRHLTYQKPTYITWSRFYSILTSFKAKLWTHKPFSHFWSSLFTIQITTIVSHLVPWGLQVQCTLFHAATTDSRRFSRQNGTWNPDSTASRKHVLLSFKPMTCLMPIKTNTKDCV